MKDKKVLLSVKDLNVKFRVRGRILTAIRGISLDIYENEAIAIVGESGSGKSVFTKTFAGMLDANGFIDKGAIIFNDDELADTLIPNNDAAKSKIEEIKGKLDAASSLEFGAEEKKAMLALEEEKAARAGFSQEETEAYEKNLQDMKNARTNLFNLKQTYDPKKEKDKIKEAAARLKEYDAKLKSMQEEHDKLAKEHKEAAAKDTAYLSEYEKKMSALKAEYEQKIKNPISEETKQRNEILAKEIYLSAARFSTRKRNRCFEDLIAEMKKAMEIGLDLNDEATRNRLFDNVTFRVRYLDETDENLHGVCILNLAHIKDQQDWMKIRGKRIATVFQDPMTSLNPLLTIGKQISSIIIKHQGCSEAEARIRAIEIMGKVGIPNPESRFDDYPFQYSGGMRQRIVIAIALSCQPKILICDEPTTALDVTIQAQILRLIKDLQKEFGYTIVFITHDLGVVANIADRVAVIYAGQIIEYGNVNEIFYDPRHPYTWALLSSLPQLAQRNTKLYSITGTPPSLYNEIKGDAFAPRNPHCMKIDTLKEPPMFQVTETHFAKTWLLHPDAPKVNKPEMIENIHEKLCATYHL